MSRANDGNGQSVSDSSVLADLIDQLTARMQAGEAIDWDDVVRRHPDHAGELLRLRPALGALGELSRSGPEELSGVAPPAGPAVGAWSPDHAPTASGVLGDFRIIREVGRGGMGVVYEAEQTSLGRRVALKVLPLAATIDPRHLQRFQNEARAAACLHHGHIVPVYSVGCERGVYFYAMQFIDGQTLADVIAALRRPAAPASADAAPHEQTTAYALPDGSPAAGAETAPAARPSTLGTEGAARGRDYFRRVAELGVQAAEALDHAHQAGVVHRDVKPGNLLLDGRGCVWVADFGLAHMQQGEAGLTMTGEMVGTLRYMSPEQALAKRVPIDHRTDVYSLGATLYELLTLRPAFEGKDRQELLRQIAFEEPSRPRQLDRNVPAELEVIALKAMEKNPAERYGTAQEMADDMRRWLDDRPIRARRPSWATVAARWARRHRTAVTAAVVCLLLVLTMAAGGVGWLMRDRQTRREDAARRAGEALKSAEAFVRQENWPEGLRSVEVAEGFLAGFEEETGLRLRARELRRALEMASRLDDARLRVAATGEQGDFDHAGAAILYAAAFRKDDPDWDSLSVDQAAERLNQRAIRDYMLAGLADWRMQTTDRDTKDRLLNVLKAADGDPTSFRNRWNAAAALGDRDGLMRLAADPEMMKQPPARLTIMAESLAAAGAGPSAVSLLSEANKRRPGDFWINFNLAYSCATLDPHAPAEAIRYFTAAVALRPASAVPHKNLGHALRDQGRLDEAVAELREAVRLEKDDATCHYNLGTLLLAQGRPDEAVAEFREAVRLKNDYAEAHDNLGNALRVQGRLGEAAAEFREAVRLKKDFAEAHNNLGTVLYDRGQLDEAAAEFREAVRLKKDDVEAHKNLGNALAGKGQLDDAVAEYREAIRLKNDDAEAHKNLGNALHAKGQCNEAVAEYRSALRLKPDYAEAYIDLGTALYDQNQLDDAVAEYREAIRLKKDDAEAHNNLGLALRRQGRLDEAVAEFQEAVRLKPDLPDAHSNLGGALGEKGLLDEAVSELREAIRLKPDFAEAHGNLGNALRATGKLTESLDEYRKGHRLGTEQRGWAYPSAQRVQEAERLVELDRKLAVILEDKEKPADDAERIALAQLCQQPFKKLYAAAAHFFADAFAHDVKLADDMQTQDRYNAACAAALAGCGKGEDAPAAEADRARLRSQALQWLRADLAAWKPRLSSPVPAERAQAVQALAHSREDDDLSGVRDADALMKLPDAERAAWRQLWADLDALLPKANH